MALRSPILRGSEAVPHAVRQLLAVHERIRAERIHRPNDRLAIEAAFLLTRRRALLGLALATNMSDLIGLNRIKIGLKSD